MRLIDADALMEKFAVVVEPSNNSDFARVPTWNNAVSLVEEMPTVDAVPVIRCKDCKYWRANTQFCSVFSSLYIAHRMPPNGYCSEAERKEE